MFYRLLLSSGQLEFLSDSKSGIDRMKCLSTLIGMAAVKESVYETRGFSTVINVGQAAVSEVALASLWKCNRKTVSKVLCRFNQMDWYHPKRATEHLSIPFCAWTPSSWTANPSETDVAEYSLL